MDNLLNNTVGLRLLNKARALYSHKPASSSKQPHFFLEHNAGPIEYDLKQTAAENHIKTLISKNEPCMIARFGSTEMEVILTYLNHQDPRNTLSKTLDYISGRAGCPLPCHAKKIMSASGIFPPSTKIALKFAEQMLADIQNIDVLGSWLSDDVWMQKRYFPNAVRIPLRDLEPFRSKTPWSEALKGQKVLVIHPFEDSIRKQYFENRDRLFPDRCVLPKFELKTLKAVQSIVGTPVSFSDWFEAQDYMREQISKIDFDTAIIGAGGYGLPLASFIKTKLNKKAVHLGGATQIVFGIKGKKWVEDPVFKDLFNPYWINPSPAETPARFKRMEGGSYW